MFYLRELIFRLKVFLFSFVLIVFVCSIYKNSLLVLLSFSLLNNFSTSLTEFSNFIYTHPIELFKVYLYSTVLISSFLIIPYFFWQVLDFFKSSFTQIRYTIIKQTCVYGVSFISCINVLLFTYFLPILWSFFKTFNLDADSTNTLNFFFELRVQEYFNFVLDFLYLINLFIVLFILIISIASIFGLATCIYWKKLFIFLNIMCATFLSPPDVSSQLILFGILHVLFEVLIFSFLYILKLKRMYEQPKLRRS
jgi:Sec-independent protein secretion pathway component TatC